MRSKVNVMWESSAPRTEQESLLDFPNSDKIKPCSILNLFLRLGAFGPNLVFNAWETIIGKIGRIVFEKRSN